MDNVMISSRSVVIDNRVIVSGDRYEKEVREGREVGRILSDNRSVNATHSSYQK